MLSFLGMSSNQNYNTPTTVTEASEEEYYDPQQDLPEKQVDQPQNPPVEPEPEPGPEPQPEHKPKPAPEPVPEQQPQPEAEQPEGETFSYQKLYQPQEGPSIDPTVIVGSPPAETFVVRNTISPSFPQVINRNPFTQPSLAAAVEIMSASVNRPDNTLNPTNAGSIPNQPTPPGYDGPDNIVSPNAANSPSNAPPRSPVTGVQIRGTNPTVAPNPNPNFSATSNTSLRPSRSQIQIASQHMSPFKRRPTGPGLVTNGPIRGDIGHHPVYLPGGGGERDPVGVPIRRGGWGTVGRVSLPPRPRSAFNRADMIVVENGHPPGPGPSTGSRLMFIEEDMPSVSVFFSPVNMRLEVLNTRFTERGDSSREATAHYRCCYDRERQVSETRYVFGCL